MSQYHHLDYRDRDRFDAYGRRVLTIRMIADRIKFLPPDSATAIASGGSGWTTTHVLIMDVFHAITGTPHPARPKAEKPVDPEQAKRVAEFNRRVAERQRAIDAGEID